MSDATIAIYESPVFSRQSKNNAIEPQSPYEITSIPEDEKQIAKYAKEEESAKAVLTRRLRGSMAQRVQFFRAGTKKKEKNIHRLNMVLIRKILRILPKGHFVVRIRMAISV